MGVFGFVIGFRLVATVAMFEHSFQLISHSAGAEGVVLVIQEIHLVWIVE
jgi:hypothetical protein